jgi:hypothetical protein
MKNVLILVFSLFIALGVSAQAPGNLAPAYAPTTGTVGVATGVPLVKKFSNAGYFYVTKDTVTNAGSNYLVTKFINSATASTVAISWTGVKTSGTLTGGVHLYGSVDGINFVKLYGLKLGVAGQTTIDSLAVANVASQSKTWVLQNNPYTWYAVYWKGAGTMVGTQTAVITNH